MIMRKIILFSALLFGVVSCSEDHSVLSAEAPDSGSAKMAANPVMRSLAGTTWDFTIHNNDIFWHADVTFYANGTTMYDEPEFPGKYTNYGTWRQVGNTVYYDLSSELPDTGYYFTGTFSGQNMSGTYTFGTGPQQWSAVQY